jgi:hypothetical protein
MAFLFSLLKKTDFVGFRLLRDSCSLPLKQFQQ